MTVLRPIRPPSFANPPCARDRWGTDADFRFPSPRETARDTRPAFLLAPPPSTRARPAQSRARAKNTDRRLRRDGPRQKVDFAVPPLLLRFSTSAPAHSSFRRPHTHLHASFTSHTTTLLYPIATMTRLADDPSKAMAIGVGMCAMSLFLENSQKGLSTNACLLRFAAFGGFLFGYVARPLSCFFLRFPPVFAEYPRLDWKLTRLHGLSRYDTGYISGVKAMPYCESLPRARSS